MAVIWRLTRLMLADMGHRARRPLVALVPLELEANELPAFCLGADFASPPAALASTFPLAVHAGQASARAAVPDAFTFCTLLRPPNLLAVNAVLAALVKTQAPAATRPCP